MKRNYLLEKIVQIIASEEKGKVLDLGCGDGKTGKKLLDLGYKVEAFDMDEKRFEFKQEIPFKSGSLGKPLPYGNEEFDLVILMEVIEHIYNPDFVISQIYRILKAGGKLILSTPNILNIGSRLRFLFEGSYEFFREPALDYADCFPAALQNMHVIAWRYQELEYLVHKNRLSLTGIYTDRVKKSLIFLAAIMKPLILLQQNLKQRRARKKGGVSYSRINKILLTPELFLGRHLVLKCQKDMG
jgi:2-polyprenyl-3-methyl-5-hydroxy-6-metoxy-1,4-benzoquinol methylase